MANQNQHTPGPWRVDEDWRADGAHQVIDQNDMTICFVALSEDEITDLANAQLLAQSPALLAALEKLSQAADAVIAGYHANPDDDGGDLRVIHFQLLWDLSDENDAAKSIIANARRTK